MRVMIVSNTRCLVSNLNHVLKNKRVQQHAARQLFCACFCLKYVNCIDIKWKNPLHAYYDGKRLINCNVENSACYLNHLFLSQSENRRGTDAFVKKRGRRKLRELLVDLSLY